MDYFKIGQRIRKFRKIRGLSQEKLAEMVNISVTHMSHIETGNTKLSLAVFADIVTALEVRADDLLGERTFSSVEYAEEIYAVLERCSANEARFIADIVRAAKESIDMHLQ